MWEASLSMQAIRTSTTRFYFWDGLLDHVHPQTFILNYLCHFVESTEYISAHLQKALPSAEFVLLQNYIVASSNWCSLQPFHVFFPSYCKHPVFYLLHSLTDHHKTQAIFRPCLKCGNVICFVCQSVQPLQPIKFHGEATKREVAL